MAVAERQLPTGAWAIDPVHSSVGFEVKHMVVATFRGNFEDFDVTLDGDGDGRLSGVVKAGSIKVKDENLQAHLGSPDFFDTERYSDIRFESTSIRPGAGDEIVIDGDLTIKDQTHPVEARGTLSEPHTNIRGGEGIGLHLETIADRTKFGLTWNAPLPKGGVAVADDVKLIVDLELVRAE